MKGIREKYLGHLVITSSSSHFFNKTDFEQYLFKELANTFSNVGPDPVPSLRGGGEAGSPYPPILVHSEYVYGTLRNKTTGNNGKRNNDVQT